MKFYGEFRWHKRSEEYYVLDVTHPEAAAYIRSVFRAWRHEWGARYFKTDFMNAGMEYGPAKRAGTSLAFSRVQVWRRMARSFVRKLAMGCGSAAVVRCGPPLAWSTQCE